MIARIHRREGTQSGRRRRECDRSGVPSASPLRRTSASRTSLYCLRIPPMTLTVHARHRVRPARRRERSPHRRGAAAAARPRVDPHPRARHGGEPRRSAAAPGLLSAAAGRLADPRPRVRRRGQRGRQRRTRLAGGRSRHGAARRRRLRGGGRRARRLGHARAAGALRRGGGGAAGGVPHRVPQHLHARRAAGRRDACSCTAAAAASARPRSASVARRGCASS